MPVRSPGSAAPTVTKHHCELCSTDGAPMVPTPSTSQPVITTLMHLRWGRLLDNTKPRSCWLVTGSSTRILPAKSHSRLARHVVLSRVARLLWAMRFPMRWRPRPTLCGMRDLTATKPLRISRAASSSQPGVHSWRLERTTRMRWQPQLRQAVKVNPYFCPARHAFRPRVTLL